jgi:hypothetical protein
MASGNNTGRAVGQPPAANVPAAQANPAAQAETPKEKSFWEKASPWVHGGLGLISFIPGASVISGGLDAAIYAAEGNYVEAGLSAAAMIPGGKVATTVGKGVKAASGMMKGAHVAEDAVKLEKLAKEAKALRELEEAAKLKKAEEEALRLKKLEEEAAAAKKAKDGTKVKKKDCKLLEKGPPGAKHQGGKHGQVKKDSAVGARESHHIPPKSISPQGEAAGPAISMDYADHRAMSSTGRATLDPVSIAQGKLAQSGPVGFLAAMMTEIVEVRSRYGDKYDPAIAWMLLYAACMGFIPGPK